MLLSWPVVVGVMYRRMAPERALIWAILAGYLLLPPLTAVKLPVVPDLDKASIPNLAALFMVLFVLRDRIKVWPDSAVGKVLIVLFILSPFASVLTNPDPVRLAVGELPALRLYDSIADVTNQCIAVLPFFLARRYLATPEAMRAIFVALLAAGLAYTIPMLIEIRVSPQLNVWIYGYFQHDFFQTIRFGGYRPVVFLPHGLWVAFFALMAVMTAWAFVRVETPEARPKYLVAALYLTAILILCKSAGAVVYGMAAVPLVLLLGRRWQILAATTLAVMVVVYPLLRGASLVPLDDILAFAKSYSPERAWSLEFRFQNEQALLDRANLRPYFGWGGYGRSLIYDAVTGSRTSISDGMWIITLGIYGWLGYVSLFGLLSLPLLLLGREALVQPSAAFSPFSGVLAIMLAFNLLDLLPNATLIPFTWLMAGSLLGYAEALAHARRAAPKTASDRATVRPRRRTVI